MKLNENKSINPCEFVKSPVALTRYFSLFFHFLSDLIYFYSSFLNEVHLLFFESGRNLNHVFFFVY